MYILKKLNREKRVRTAEESAALQEKGWKLIQKKKNFEKPEIEEIADGLSEKLKKAIKAMESNQEPEGEAEPGEDAEPEGEAEPGEDAEPEGEAEPGEDAEPEGEAEPGEDAEPEGEAEPGEDAEPEGEAEPGEDIEPEEKPKKSRTKSKE